MFLGTGEKVQTLQPDVSLDMKPETKLKQMSSECSYLHPTQPQICGEFFYIWKLVDVHRAIDIY